MRGRIALVTQEHTKRRRQSGQELLWLGECLQSDEEGFVQVGEDESYAEKVVEVDFAKAVVDIAREETFDSGQWSVAGIERGEAEGCGRAVGGGIGRSLNLADSSNVVQEVGGRREK